MLGCSLTHAISLTSAQCSPSTVLLHSGAHIRLQRAIHQLSMVWQLHWYLLMINTTSKRLIVGALRHGFHSAQPGHGRAIARRSPPSCLKVSVYVLG